MSVEINSNRSASVIADAIREEILNDSFSQGSPLREVSLAARFGVSRRTIREALLALTADGLVTHRHNQGASVRKYERQDVRDLYRVRRLLESEAARCVSTVSSTLLERIDDACNAMETASEHGFTSVELAKADAAFHGTVIALLESPRFSEFYSSIAQQVVRVITIAQETDVALQRDVTTIVAEHRAIRDALMHRDGWEAQRLITEHIDRHEQNLIVGLDAH
ncbi:GntR family transcriptional regulator [Salinibacterium sp. TMP30]|uniref:GntR family transcriptional regulator n=1 Tax=Salinibacterium sp. TMP30 TaxID=3138237 RepID=UPI003139AE07